MFLIGGPAFSGTTLLVFLLDRGDVVCLDEPDFHDPRQRHRGIPVLRARFPHALLPEPPTTPLSFAQALDVLEACQTAIAPFRLGMKTCDQTFLQYAELYRLRGWPVVAIVRDVRDALVRPLPPWTSERNLNHDCRSIWERRDAFDLWVRYEDLVASPAETLARVGDALGVATQAPEAWSPESVHGPLLKLDRHDLLRSGAVSSERVGIWRSSGRTFSPETHETARQMGYAG